MLLLLALLSSSSAAFTKCCPQGQSLEPGSLVCRESSHTWSYADLEYNKPDCAPVVQYADLDSQASCIDNLLGTDRVYSLTCPNSTTFSVPNVQYLGKCCPMLRVYESRLQSCWGEQNDTWPTDFLNTLMYGATGVLDVESGIPECEPDEVVVDHLVPSINIRRLPTGSISMKFDANELIFSPDKMCIDKTERDDIFVIRSCENQRVACKDHVCIRKCCPDGYSYFDDHNCSKSHNFIRPIKIYEPGETGMEPRVLKEPAYWFGGLNCDKYIDEAIAEYAMSNEGAIFSFAESMWMEPGVFCVENVYSMSRGVNKDFVFACFPEDEVKPDVHIWTTLGMIVSSLFLFLTFLVYAALPSLKNLHGKTLMCHVFCLLTAFITLSITHFGTDQLSLISAIKVCAAFGYILLFFFLASFFWLNVISFDIWWTFGSMRPVMDRKKREVRKFVLYSCYAWAAASLITTLAVLADLLLWVPHFLRPGMGIESCWFEPNSQAVFYFFIGPVGVLLTVNMVFFFLTLKHCSKVKSELDKVGHTPISDKKFKSDWSKFVMNGKLFIVMGINWAMEFLSAISVYAPFAPKEIWYLPDMFNACQGLVIFAIFVLKRRVLSEIRKKLGFPLWRTGRPPPRQPSVTTLYTANNTGSSVIDLRCQMKKSVSESKLSPLPPHKHVPHHLHVKSISSNRLLLR